MLVIINLAVVNFESIFNDIKSLASEGIAITLDVAALEDISIVVSNDIGVNSFLDSIDCTVTIFDFTISQMYCKGI